MPTQSDERSLADFFFFFLTNFFYLHVAKGVKDLSGLSFIKINPRDEGSTFNPASVPTIPALFLPTINGVHVAKVNGQ